MRSRLRELWQLRRHRAIAAVVMAVVLLAGITAGWAVPRLTHVTHANAPAAPDTVGVVVPTSGTNAYYLRYANASGYADKAFVFGASGMIPIAGDWDNRGVSTIGAYDPSQAEFWLSNFNESGGPVTYGFFYGSPGDIPLVGRWTSSPYHLYDGVGVFDPNSETFSLTIDRPTCCSTITTEIQVTFGIPGDIPIAGDWNGTGVDSIGVYRPSNGMFYLDATPHSGNSDYAVAFGPPGSIPITGDWTGAGHDGIGVVYNGVVYLKNNPLTSGYADTAFAYGPAGAAPITGHFVAPNALPTTVWLDISNGNDVYTRNRLTEGPDGAMWITVSYPGFHEFPGGAEVARLAPVAGQPVNYPPNVINYSPPHRLFATTRITSGPDGNLWFGDNGSGYIGKITTSHVYTLYTPPHGTDFEGVASGLDGNVWYTVKDANEILKVTTSGGFTEYPIPAANSQPTAITAGPDGALWFTENGTGKIGRITTGGSISEYAASTTAGYTQVDNIVAGPDGNLWYSLTNSGSPTPGHLVKMGTAGNVMAEYSVTSNAISDVTAGPDGNLWFIDSIPEGGSTFAPADLGRVTTSGATTLYPQLNTQGYNFQSFGIASGPNANIWAGTAEYDLH